MSLIAQAKAETAAATRSTAVEATIGGDGTLHSLTLGGNFRLMPLDENRHILTFSCNDGPVRVLDIGDAEALQDAPGERHSNDVLHVSIGGERAELRGVCAAGVLGVLEWYGGSRLLLGHLPSRIVTVVMELESIRSSWPRRMGPFSWFSPNLGGMAGDSRSVARSPGAEKPSDSARVACL